MKESRFGGLDELITNQSFTNQDQIPLTLAAIDDFWRKIHSTKREPVAVKIIHNGCSEFFLENFGVPANATHTLEYLGLSVLESGVVPEGEIWVLDNENRVLKIVKYIKKNV